MGNRRVIALRLLVRRGVPRVVLDTNLFVAAYWSPHSASAQVLSACEGGRLTLLYSQAIRREMNRILANARTSGPYRERIAHLLEGAEDVQPTRSLRVVPEDPDDDKFVECAVEGEADAIVSSDAHLLCLGEFEGVRVIKPTAFVREFLA